MMSPQTSAEPYAEAVHLARPHAGQQRVAASMRALLAADTFAAAGGFFAALSGCGHADAAASCFQYLKVQPVLAAGLGILFSGPAWNWIKTSLATLARVLPAASQPALEISGRALEIVLDMALLVISSAWLASGTYNPFIYFRF